MQTIISPGNGEVDAKQLGMLTFCFLPRTDNSEAQVARVPAVINYETFASSVFSVYTIGTHSNKSMGHQV